MTQHSSEPAPKQAAPARRNWWLIGSLALNVFFIGALASAVLTHGPGRGGPKGQRDIAAPYIQALELRDKRALRDQMRAQMPHRGEMRRANRSDYAAFTTLLRAEPFDAEAARAVMDRQLERSGQVLMLGYDLAFEHISQMSAAERAAYADRIETVLARKKTRKPRRE